MNQQEIQQKIALNQATLAFAAGVSQTYADESDFYDVATRIIYGEG